MFIIINLQHLSSVELPKNVVNIGNYVLNELSIIENTWQYPRILVCGGCSNFPGSVALVGQALTQNSRAKVEIYTTPDATNLLRTLQSSFKLLESNVEKYFKIEEFSYEMTGRDIYIVGPGLDTKGHEYTSQILAEEDSVIIVDAGALCTLQKSDVNNERHMPLILTPHYGELDRLFTRLAQDVEDELPILEHLSTREMSAWKSTIKSGFNKVSMEKILNHIAILHRILCPAVVLVAKGPNTFIYGSFFQKNRFIGVLQAPNSGLAKAGTGDVLTACIALEAVRLKPREVKEEVSSLTLYAACGGVDLHSKCGRLAAADIGVDAMLAEDIIDYIISVENVRHQVSIFSIASSDN